MKRAIVFAIFWGASLVVFAALNFSIWQKEHQLRSGETMLLRIAPRDPRSLMQGDYMTLRYELTTDPQVEAETKQAGADGRIVVKLDEHAVARFARVYHGEPLAVDERLLRYRRRGDGLSVAVESFFFQEGQANLYQPARYGELRVSAEGDTLLVGLRGENFEPLGSME